MTITMDPLKTTIRPPSSLRQNSSPLFTLVKFESTLFLGGGSLDLRINPNLPKHLIQVYGQFPGLPPDIFLNWQIRMDNQTLTSNTPPILYRKVRTAQGLASDRLLPDLKPVQIAPDIEACTKDISDFLSANLTHEIMDWPASVNYLYKTGQQDPDSPANPGLVAQALAGLTKESLKTLISHENQSVRLFATSLFPRLPSRGQSL